MRISLFLAALCLSATLRAATFTVMTYNVENYLRSGSETRPAKSSAAQNAVRDSILSVRPDLLALQEMGSTNDLSFLQHELGAAGWDLRHSEWIQGSDTNVHLALLSRFPIVSRTPHLKERFVIDGRAHAVSRGILDVEISLPSGRRLTLIALHLKSRRVVPDADEAEWRLREARAARAVIDEILRARPTDWLLVAGDLNDDFSSDPLREMMGRGRQRLIDLRPSEQTEKSASYSETRRTTWTHFFSRDDTYSRFDYILVNPPLAARCVRSRTFIPVLANWGEASDHRPVVATFSDSE